ncbi:ankyrin [Hypoxylon sp. FL1150]|nr:ankyrin [Hypoxylon sp. FL1150]
MQGMQEIIDIILNQNPDLDRAIDGNTPLAAALRTRNENLILFLKENGVLDRLRGEELGIAITAALDTENLELADYLLDLDSDATGFELMDALSAALYHDYDHIALRLLAAGANITPYRSDTRHPPFLLYIAIRKRKLALVQAMLDSRMKTRRDFQSVDDNGHRHSVIEAVVEWGDRSILSELLLKTVELEGGSYIQRALEKADQVIFWMLVKLAEPNDTRIYGYYALIIAVVRENNLLLRQLFDLGVSSVNEGSTDEQGMRCQDMNIVNKLLNAGFDTNSTWSDSSWGCMNLSSPLLDAIGTRNIKIVRLLIDRGARVNEPVRVDIRRTPLQKAAEVGSLDVVRLLLEKSADVNAPAAGRYGGTALQFAAIVGNCTMATELIERGARFNIAPSWGNGGRWPLEGAAENGRIDMIQLLWYANRGDFDDKQYQKAMRLAEQNGNIGCRDKLVELQSTPRPLTVHLPISRGGQLNDMWGDGSFPMFG